MNEKKKKFIYECYEFFLYLIYVNDYVVVYVFVFIKYVVVFMLFLYEYV